MLVGGSDLLFPHLFTSTVCWCELFLLFFCFFLKTTIRHSHLPDTVTAQRCEVLTGLNFSPKRSFLHLPHDRRFNGEYFDLSKQTKALCTYKAL